MMLDILYPILIVSILGFLAFGMLTILQFTGFLKEKRSRPSYVGLFTLCTALTVLLMVVFVIIVAGS